MEILFLTYHGFNPGSGISKKMLARDGFMPHYEDSDNNLIKN